MDLKAWWAAWLATAKRVGHYQGEISVGLVYLFVVGPIWLITRVSGKRLLPYGGARGSTWLPRRSDPRTLADLERPY